MSSLLFPIAVAIVAISSLKAAVPEFGVDYHGDGTYYGDYGGGGSCSLGVNDTVLTPPNAAGLVTVALNNEQYTNGVSCGLCVEYWGNGVWSSGDNAKNAIPTTPTPAFVNNICPECHKGSLDIAKSLDGRGDLSFRAIDCPLKGPLQYVFQGSNKWYMKLQVRNTLRPIAKLWVDVNDNGNWGDSIAKTNDNFFVKSFQYTLPLHVKFEDILGEQVEDYVPLANCDGNPQMVKSVLPSGCNAQLTPLDSSVSGAVDASCSNKLWTEDGVICGETTTTSTATSASSRQTTTTTTSDSGDTTTTTTTSDMGCTADWGPCGGKNYPNAHENCCSDDFFCDLDTDNDWYKQCIKKPTQSTTTTTPDASGCVALWAKCGGEGYTGSTCCQEGFCVRNSEWYSQCKPHRCVKLWGQCGGKDYTGETCCHEGSCVFANDYYSQCK